MEEDFSSGTDDSSEEEDETQDTLSGIFGEPAGDVADGDTPTQSPSATPSRRQNNTVIDVDDEEDEDDGQSSRRRGTRRSPAQCTLFRSQ